MRSGYPLFAFRWTAIDALAYYAKAFHAGITELQTYGEADFPTPEEANDLPFSIGPRM